MRPSLKTLIAAALAAALAHGTAAQAAIFGDDEARRAILDLRNRIETLQRDVNARLDAKTDKSGTLDLATQNEQLRQEIARLRGQIEVLTNELANTQQRQKDFYVDLDGRLRKLEPQKMTIDGNEVNVEPGEQAQYDSAVALLKAADYRGAAAAFNDFLRRYPRSGFAPSAQYLLGTAYYAQRDYQNAINAQQSVINNYPDNSRAADAMLNIASSQAELKDRAAARKTLETLIGRYPESGAAKTAKDRLAAFR